MFLFKAYRHSEICKILKMLNTMYKAYLSEKYKYSKKDSRHDPRDQGRQVEFERPSRPRKENYDSPLNRSPELHGKRASRLEASLAPALGKSVLVEPMADLPVITTDELLMKGQVEEVESLKYWVVVGRCGIWASGYLGI